MATNTLLSEEALGKLNKTDISHLILDIARRTGYYYTYSEADDNEEEEPTQVTEEAFKMEIERLRDSTNNNDGSKNGLIRILKLIDGWHRLKEDEKDKESKLLDRVKATLDIDDDEDEEKILDKLAKISNFPKGRPKIDKNIPKFHGNGSQNENINDWLFLVEQFMKFHRVNESEMIAIITPLLRGQALQMLKRGLSKDPEYTWSSLEVNY